LAQVIQKDLNDLRRHKIV